MPSMNEAELTSLTLRLPKALRKKIQARAKAEERTESQFVRYHLAAILASGAVVKRSENPNKDAQ